VSAIEQLFRFFLRPRWMYSFRTTNCLSDAISIS
jgi:hypothetical protein